MKDISIYLNVISTVLFVGTFIALFFKRTINRYKYIVMAYGVSVGLSVISDVLKMLYKPYTMTGYIFTVAGDVVFIILAVWFYKMYRKWVDLNMEDDVTDTPQEWVLARARVSKPEFVIGKNWVTANLTEARVFTSAPEAIRFRTDNKVSVSYHPVPKELFTK